MLIFHFRTASKYGHFCFLPLRRVGPSFVVSVSFSRPLYIFNGGVSIHVSGATHMTGSLLSLKNPLFRGFGRIYPPVLQHSFDVVTRHRFHGNYDGNENENGKEEVVVCYQGADT